MPSTINSIGTRYYGKKNAASRQGACSHCHHDSVLTSYDTRLFFVVFFIPIIPLGRKHVIDQCQICTRHYALPQKKWEEQRQRDLAAAAERFSSQPTPETAMQVHSRLVEYQEFNKAAEFRELMLAKFPDDPRIHEYIGLALGRLGKNDEAFRHMERAHALQPDLPTPRVNVALRRLKEHKVDEAHGLLAPLLESGAGRLYSLDALFVLAKSFETHQRPARALEVYQHLLREHPELGQNPGFRRDMTRLERAVGETISALPRKQLFPNSGARRKAIAVCALVALVIIGLLIGNEAVRRKRTLYIVNGFERPLDVEIPGLPKTHVASHSFATLDLAEGDYVARVSGAIDETVPFALHADYFDRWSDHPMWVLNPGGAEILERFTAVYSKLGDDPPTTDYHYGERFLMFHDVKHPFSKLPERLMLEKGSHMRLTSVNRFELDPAILHDHLSSTSSAQEALQFAESRLTLDPNDESLLLSYARNVRTPEDLRRVKAFLKAGLGRRPVAVPWHRLHQAYHRGNGREDALRTEYDEFLAAEPKDPALLYLRSQISTTREEARRFYEQAFTLDPQHPYALFPQAVAEVARGDLAAALPKLEAAAKQSPKDTELTALRDAVRLAQGQVKDLLREIRAKLTRNPMDSAQITKLAAVLVATGQPKDALREVATFLGQFGQKQPEHIKETGEILRYTVHHLAGDFSQAEKILATSKEPAAPGLRFTLLLDQLKPAEAMAMPDVESLVDNNVADLLAISIAWQLTGDATKAAEAREDAAVVLDEGDAEQRLAAAMLTANTPPAAAELDSLILDPAEKCALCVALGQKFPAARARCFALARKLNFIRVFPYHIILRATAPSPQ